MGLIDPYCILYIVLYIYIVYIYCILYIIYILLYIQYCILYIDPYCYYKITKSKSNLLAKSLNHITLYRLATSIVEGWLVGKR